MCLLENICVDKKPFTSTQKRQWKREREGHGEKTTSSQSAALKSLILSLSGMMEGRGAPSVEN